MRASLRIGAALCVAALLLGVLTAFPAPFCLTVFGQSGESRAPAQRGNDTVPLGCSSMEELIALVAEGATDLQLTGDILVSGRRTLRVDYPLKIDLGRYGIVLEEGASLYLDGEIHFTGSGERTPLITLEQDAYLYGYSCDVRVAATGDDAVAVATARDASIYCFDISLEAAGSRSTALLVQGNTRLRNLAIHAPRADSVAISADGDLLLDECRVTGVMEVAGDLTLDLTQASPLPENARIVSRRANWLYGDDSDMGMFGLWAAAGQENPLPETISIELLDTDGENNAMMLYDVPMRWESGGADLSRPGSYTVYGTPEISSTYPEVEGLERTAVSVKVVEAGKPWLVAASAPGLYVKLHYLEPVADPGELRLYHSLDGETWSLMDNDARVSAWDATAFRLQYDQMHYFQLEVVGGPMAGRSNVLSFWLDVANKIGSGGDRDNGDRDEQGPPGSGIIVPPPGTDDEDEDDDDPNGDDDDSGGGSQPDPGPSHPGPAEPPIWPEPPWENSGGTAGSGIRDADLPAGRQSHAGTAEDATESAQAADTAAPAQPAAGRPPQLDSTALAVQLTAYPNGLTVVEPGIKAVLPPALIKAIGLAEGETFTIRAARPEPDRFSIVFLVEDQVVTDLGGETYRVYLDDDSAGESAPFIQCLNESGTAISATAEDGKLAFVLAATGEFRLTDTRPAVTETAADPGNTAQPAEVPQPGETDAPGRSLPLIVLLIPAVAVIGAGVAALWRRRRRGN